MTTTTTNRPAPAWTRTDAEKLRDQLRRVRCLAAGLVDLLNRAKLRNTDAHADARQTLRRWSDRTAEVEAAIASRALVDCERIAGELHRDGTRLSVALFELVDDLGTLAHFMPRQEEASRDG